MARIERNPRTCECGGTLRVRSGYFDASGRYRRYKVCDKCGRTVVTGEEILQPYSRRAE